MNLSKAFWSVGVGALSVAVFAASTSYLSAIAQRVGPRTLYPLLDNARCVEGSSNGRFSRSQSNAVVQRQLYESDFRISVGKGRAAVLACSIDNTDFDSLTLLMGIDDVSAEYGREMTVNVWQSGSVIESYSNTQGHQLISTNLDLRNTVDARPGNVSIELVCEQSSYNFCGLHFIEAWLSAPE